MYTLFRTERPKNISCPVACPHIGHTREEPRRERKEAGRSRGRKERENVAVEEGGRMREEGGMGEKSKREGEFLV